MINVEVRQPCQTRQKHQLYKLFCQAKHCSDPQNSSLTLRGKPECKLYVVYAYSVVYIEGEF